LTTPENYQSAYGNVLARRSAVHGRLVTSLVQTVFIGKRKGGIKTRGIIEEWKCGYHQDRGKERRQGRCGRTGDLGGEILAKENSSASAGHSRPKKEYR
jgi:hypothetical protein